jgi:hypothetical protein
MPTNHEGEQISFIRPIGENLALVREQMNVSLLDTRVPVYGRLSELAREQLGRTEGNLYQDPTNDILSRSVDDRDWIMFPIDNLNLHGTVPDYLIGWLRADNPWDIVDTAPDQEPAKLDLEARFGDVRGISVDPVNNTPVSSELEVTDHAVGLLERPRGSENFLEKVRAFAGSISVGDTEIHYRLHDRYPLAIDQGNIRRYTAWHAAATMAIEDMAAAKPSPPKE